MVTARRAPLRWPWIAVPPWPGLAAGFIGACLLPWHAQENFGFTALLALIAAEPDQASALAQAARFGRWWLWPPVLAVFVIAVAILRGGTRGTKGRWLVAASGLALAGIALQGMAVGEKGWAFAFLTGTFGELGGRQSGMGLGAALSIVGLLILLSEGLALKGAFRGDRFVAGAVVLLIAAIAVFTAWPVARLLSEVFRTTEAAGPLAAFADRLLTGRIWSLACLWSPRQCGVAINSMLLAFATATAATMLGLAFALVVTRTALRGRPLLRLLTILPIITPPFVIGLGLILIFGRSGIVNQLIEWATGVALGRWIYGSQGVWLAQVFAFTPTAFLILIGVVEGLSPALEEASQTLRASLERTFTTVTLPLIRPGLANAFLVVFIESIADFGNPIILGGSFGVLSTEIFFAVVGAQSDFGRAAGLAMVLLAIALAVFIAQRRLLGGRSYVTMSGKGDSGLAVPLPTGVRRLALAIVLPWAALTVVVYAMALAGAFVKVWGRDWTPTLSHFTRAFAIEHGASGLALTGGAWPSLLTTLQLAAIAAPLTAATGLVAAWILSRQRFAGRASLEFALMLTFAVPGTVIGVAYILTYNVPPLEITGSALILVVCFVFRNLPVGVRSGLAAMSQIDRSLDEASATLGAGGAMTLRRVVLPLLKPAIVTALVYAFVRAITTVSAVIFLVSARHELATVYIINRAINGDYGLAIAYSAVLIVIMAGAVLAIQLLVGERRLGRRRSRDASTPRTGKGAP